MLPVVAGSVAGAQDTISASLTSVATSLPWPPHLPLAGSEPGSFAEATITKRLPAILASTLKDVEAVAARYAAQGQPELSAQVKQLGASVSELREEILQLGPVTPPATPQGSHVPPGLAATVAATQEALWLWQERMPGPHTWLTLPWLLVECVMYVRLATAQAQQPQLAAMGFDMFAEAKSAAWSKCVVAVAELAASLERVQDALAAASGVSGPSGYHAALRPAMAEVVQWSLWGNKTDLSLLVDATAINPAASSAAAAGFSSSNSTDEDGGDVLLLSNPHIIVDEFQAAWDHLEAVSRGSQGPGRVDIILDNAGLELYGDLLLAEFLIEHGLASQVVLHGKPFPWFVSDTLRSDLDTLLSDCGPSSPTPAAVVAAYGGDEKEADAAWEVVRKLGTRWAEHLASGRWVYTTDPFWVTPLPFCWMQAAAPQLHASLATSNLLIFKGDLNYRKLVHDCRWPSTTPFASAVQGFCPAPMLVLRTLKADVVAGLRSGQAQQLDQQDPQWLVDGKWGMVQFLTPQQVIRRQ